MGHAYGTLLLIRYFGSFWVTFVGTKVTSRNAVNPQVSEEATTCRKGVAKRSQKKKALALQARPPKV
jgi:hypothetical protein